MFTIEENKNLPNSCLFLMHNGSVIGGAHKVFNGKFFGQWAITINKPYDSETDSDVELLGYVQDKEAAKQSLERNKHLAYMPKS